LTAAENKPVSDPGKPEKACNQCDFGGVFAPPDRMPIGWTFARQNKIAGIASSLWRFSLSSTDGDGSLELAMADGPKEQPLAISA